MMGSKDQRQRHSSSTLTLAPPLTDSHVPQSHSITMHGPRYRPAARHASEESISINQQGMGGRGCRSVRAWVKGLGFRVTAGPAAVGAVWCRLEVRDHACACCVTARPAGGPARAFDGPMKQ